MLLTIDIGNTNITLCLFQGSDPVDNWRLATDHDRMPDEYGLQLLGLLDNAHCKLADLDGICLASVVPTLTTRIVQACQQYLNQKPLIVDHRLKFDLKILYDDPQAVGADRIADAVAVKHHYGGPACIIDFGTATTFNAISKEGDYLGGAISPGLGIAIEALFNRTAQLPRIELSKPPSVVGSNTVHAIQSGMIFGFVSLVEGMISRFRESLGKDMKVIATGGFATIITRETNQIDMVLPLLTLEGIRLIWEFNRGGNDQSAIR